MNLFQSPFFQQPLCRATAVLLSMLTVLLSCELVHAEDEFDFDSLLAKFNDAEYGTSSQSTHLFLLTKVLGKSFSDTYNNTNYAGAEFELLGTRRLLPNLSANLDLAALLTTGSYTSQYSTTEGKAPSTFYVNEASLSFKPLSFLQFDAGVLLNQFSNLPSIFQEEGFPGVRESIGFDGSDLSLRLFSAQYVPTSSTPAVQSTEGGTTTSLLVSGIEMNTDPKKERVFGLNSRVSYFDFNHLNSSAATDSEYLGNAIVPEGSQAMFVYQFAGVEASSEAVVRLSELWKLKFKGAYLINNEAPVHDNMGYLYSAGVSMPLFHQDVTILGGYFYDEADTLPATYTSGGRGGNDRFGNFVRISVLNLPSKVIGFFQYTQANVIAETPYLADRQIVLVGVGMGYDVL